MPPEKTLMTSMGEKGMGRKRDYRKCWNRMDWKRTKSSWTA